MPLQIPDEQAHIQQLQANVRTELPELDPTTKKANFIAGIVIAFAKAVYHFYLALKDFANRQVHPQTATGSVLFKGWWTALTSLQRTPVTAASGYLIATGTAGAIVPIGTGFSAGSDSYEATSSSTITNQILRAVTLQILSGVAVFETNLPHGLATGQIFTVSGALDEAYNGEFSISVTAENEFTYAPLTEPSVAAGSDALATSAYASVPTRALIAGKESNVDGGSMLFETAVSGVDSTALVPFSGVSGGADLEDPEFFRDRLLDALASTLGVFTGNEIRDVVRNIPGVTRVYIRKAQIDPEPGWPNEGQTKVIFMRDNDANPIPSAQEVQDVKAVLVSTILPAHAAEEDLIVLGPTPVSIDFQFSSITPDNASMRLAITAQLNQYFEENIGIGADLPKRAHSDLLIADLNCTIKNSISLETGQTLSSFDLNTPASDTDIDPDSIPVLGSVVFAS